MRCTTSYRENNNIKFGANARIVRQQYYKITDKVIEDAVRKTVKKRLDIATALAEGIGKSSESLRAAYGDAFDEICEHYTLVKDNFPLAQLKEALKEFIKFSKMTDENGILTKLPLRVLVIKPGDSPINNMIYADTFINNGVKGLTRMFGNRVVLSNVDDAPLEVKAFGALEVNNSHLKKINSYGKLKIKDSSVDESIEATSDIIGDGVSTPKLVSRLAGVHLFGANTISEGKAYKSFNSHQSLIADKIESEANRISLMGANNHIGVANAPKGTFNFHGFDSDSNFVGEINAENIEAVNLRGSKFVATKSLLLVGDSNKVDDLVSNDNMILENVHAKNATSKRGSIYVDGDKNVIENTLWAKQLAQLRNLKVANVYCETFNPKGNLEIDTIVINRD